jgi:hypothetical protein
MNPSISLIKWIIFHHFSQRKKKKEKDFALANQKGRIRKSSGER